MLEKIQMSLTDDYGTFVTVDGITYLDETIIKSLHDATILEYGGVNGENYDSLGSICHDAFYQEDKSIEGLAAHYISRIVKGHPFNDGNKRTAFLSSVVFLGANSFSYYIDDEEKAAVEISNIAGADTMEEAYGLSKEFVMRNLDNPAYGPPGVSHKINSVENIVYILSGI
jgi:death-on-curing protein